MTLTHHHQLPVFFCTSNFQTPCMYYRVIKKDCLSFKLAVQLRKFFNSVIYNTATGYVLLVYLTNI
jgi:hypothetical protein